MLNFCYDNYKTPRPSSLIKIYGVYNWLYICTLVYQLQLKSNPPFIKFSSYHFNDNIEKRIMLIYLCNRKGIICFYTRPNIVYHEENFQNLEICYKYI